MSSQSWPVILLFFFLCAGQDDDIVYSSLTFPFSYFLCGPKDWCGRSRFWPHKKRKKEKTKTECTANAPPINTSVTIDGERMLCPFQSLWICGLMHPRSGSFPRNAWLGHKFLFFLLFLPDPGFTKKQRYNHPGSKVKRGKEKTSDSYFLFSRSNIQRIRD